MPPATSAITTSTIPPTIFKNVFMVNLPVLECADILRKNAGVMNPLSVLLFATILATNVATVQEHYDNVESKRLVPMLSEVLQFPTVEGNTDARHDQQTWLLRVANDLGFTARDAGLVTEIELPAASPNAPILGLVVHGDVQPVDADAWSFPPFSGRSDSEYVYGRGAADDKGPLVQALLAMKALKESGIERTHTIRLLVGSDEESANLDMAEYLKTHQPPDYTLVLDAEFPVVAGEKAWNSLTLSTSLGERGTNTKPYVVSSLSAGLSPSIVPDNAEIDLRWVRGTPDWEPLEKSLKAFKLPEGRHVATLAEADRIRIVVYGKSSHAGVNLTEGRNALVGLAQLMRGRLPRGGADDLLAFARIAGQDLYGTGLGITDNDPLWGRYAVNVAMIKPDPEVAQKTMLTINIRSIPPRTGAQLKKRLDALVKKFAAERHASIETGGYFKDKPLSFNPKSKLIRRLLDDYAAATGTRVKPAISGGGTYAKRIPNAIAFGMWFPSKPYPGHDVDEKISIDDLQKGTRVLIYALTDIATGKKIEGPFAP
jgi:succinyl-diaminopimelate desuccinylase